MRKDKLQRIRVKLLADCVSDRQREELNKIFDRLADGIKTMHELRRRKDDVGDVARILISELIDATQEEVDGAEEEAPTKKVTH
jgi:hypothetical protein